PDQIGSIAYRCLHCGQGKQRVAMSCKSSLCLRCAKVYVDNGVAQEGKMLHDGVIYRHIVLTVPEVLSTPFYQHADAWLSLFMPCGGKFLAEFFRTVSGMALKGGSIVVVQTNGRNCHDKPPLPIIATSGGEGTRGCLHLYRSDDAAGVSERFPTDTLLRGAGDQDGCQDQRPDAGGLGEGEGHGQGCHQDHRGPELSGTLPSKFRSRSVALSALPP